MAFTVLKQDKILKYYQDYVNDETVREDLMNSADKELRNYCLHVYSELIVKNYGDYRFDLEFGFRLFDFLNSNENFNEILKNENDFWKTFAVFIIPDIVAKRFGVNSTGHYYSKPGRMYPYTLYWFINLIWQGSEEGTREIANCKGFTTDTILQFCERPTKIGINLEFYRALAVRYSRYYNEHGTTNVLINGENANILRKVFILNTSRLLVTRPEIYFNGVYGYVDMLFRVVEGENYE